MAITALMGMARADLTEGMLFGPDFQGRMGG